MNYLDRVVLLRLEAGERHTMKSMNFIFSSGALIFLLMAAGGLDFAAAGTGTAAHGTDCDTTAGAITDASKFINSLKTPYKLRTKNPVI